MFASVGYDEFDLLLDMLFIKNADNKYITKQDFMDYILVDF